MGCTTHVWNPLSIRFFFLVFFYWEIWKRFSLETSGYRYLKAILHLKLKMHVTESTRLLKNNIIFSMYFLGSDDFGWSSRGKIRTFKVLPYGEIKCPVLLSIIISFYRINDTGCTKVHWFFSKFSDKRWQLMALSLQAIYMWSRVLHGSEATRPEPKNSD